MGTRRTYVRLSAAELERALVEPAWAKARLAELGSGGPWDEQPESLRALNVDKSWSEIDLVMIGAGMSRTVLNGFNFLYPRDKPLDSAWEYLGENDRRALSPPTYRPPDEVRVVAARLNQRPFGELFDAFDPQATSGIEQWEVHGWPMDRDYTVSHGERLQRFFAAAAGEGEAMVSYLR